MRRASPAFPCIIFALAVLADSSPIAAAPRVGLTEQGPFVAGGSAAPLLRDLDGDGDLDIRSANEVWMNEGEGRFSLVSWLDPERRTTVFLGSLETAADLARVFGPFDGDRPDPPRDRVARPGLDSAGGSIEAAADTDPPHERYLCLDGTDDYASAADDASLDLGTGAQDDFTIETFFYMPDTSNTTIDGLIWKEGSFGVWVWHNASLAAGKERLVFRIYTNPNNVAEYVFFFGDIELGAGWHHVAAIWDNENTAEADYVAVYVDGTLVIANSGLEMTPGLINSASPVWVGNSWPQNPAAGGIDETRLSAAVRYAGGSIAVPSAPFTNDSDTRALWHLDEAPGATAFADASSFGNALSGVNGAQSCGLACLPIDVTPDALPGGAVDTQYSEMLGASGGAAPYSFAVTEGSLPPGLTLGGGGLLSGSPATRGEFVFTVTATDAEACTGTQAFEVEVIAAFGAPPDFTAAATGAAQVALSWAPVDGAVSYEVHRSPSIGTAYQPVGSTSGTMFNDAMDLSADTTYLYKVRAVGDAQSSPFSAVDAATTMVFTDASLAAAVIKRVHLIQLRTAVDAMRTAGGLGPASYAESIVAGSTPVKRSHVVELRNALAAARTAIGLSAVSYTDPTLSVGTAIQGVHLTELRAGTQ